MKQEVIATGKTIEAALQNGAEQLGVSSEQLEYEVVDLPKKGFLGIGEVPAKIKVIYNVKPDSGALAFVNTLISDMELDATAEMTDIGKGGKEKLITITGADAGTLIGHHGDTLDALQYLTGLAANKKEENESRDYTKISVDIENYRAKREETLNKLAERMAAKVLKYKKSITLEPMNPYERRIIHSAVQNIEGVTTLSVGTENNRRIVIMTEESKASRPPRKPRQTANGKSEIENQ